MQRSLGSMPDADVWCPFLLVRMQSGSRMRARALGRVWRRSLLTTPSTCTMIRHGLPCELESQLERLQPLANATKLGPPASMVKKAGGSTGTGTDRREGVRSRACALKSPSVLSQEVTPSAVGWRVEGSPNVTIPKVQTGTSEPGWQCH